MISIFSHGATKGTQENSTTLRLQVISNQLDQFDFNHIKLQLMVILKKYNHGLYDACRQKESCFSNFRRLHPWAKNAYTTPEDEKLFPHLFSLTKNISAKNWLDYLSYLKSELKKATEKNCERELTLFQSLLLATSYAFTLDQQQLLDQSCKINLKS